MDAGPAERPALDLSGERLSAAMEAVIRGAEPQGGVERWVSAIHLKASLFDEMLGQERFRNLSETDFKALCVFIAPVRRRIGGWLEGNAFAGLQAGIVELLDGSQDTTTADARVAAFCARFPADRKHRWVRDLAAELLHFSRPEQYPLMARWVWDAKANTGVLREIWFHPDVDRLRIPVPDDYETFLVLREELSQFLSKNGVFRDMPFYIDLLFAEIYAEYISAQGGSYLRTDFSSAEDPMQYARRMLGLDGLDTETGRTRLKLIDGEAFVLSDPKLLN
ncbi:MAG: hypothetical protein HY057_01135 [Rhodospirillales bacterium]|nr:hypothetical protein [Rhodospirillales bacterium]